MRGVPAKSCPSCRERYDADVLFCPRDGTPLASARNPSLAASERDPYLGTELPGQIRLDHLIGIGSMGRVYRAFQGGIERDVAVKVLHRELSGNAELVARFHREAKVASRLVHPNVVQVLMTGTLPQRAEAGLGGELYLVMEHLDGISLLSALAAAGTSGEGAALPLPRALHVALQICDAVGEAHAQGIVHRDIKPENVMLVRRGDDPDYVKVLDFGIARLDWVDRGLATQTGLIFGTAKYISPEGAEGHSVGPPADVYSIATMLYQMLAGRTPFEGDSPVALLVQHTHAPPPELRSVARASYVPGPLAAAIMANLAKKPSERAPNARALGRDLIAVARASGLFPEEIATQSTLLSPASLGAVKLVSKERTKAHELSADLAAKIGGVAATAAPPSSVASTPPQSAASEPPPGDPAPPEPSTQAAATLVSGEAAAVGGLSSRTEVMSPGSAPSGPTPVGATQIDAGARRLGATVPGAPLPEPLTTLPVGRKSRAHTARLLALLACLMVVVPAVIVGGRRLGGFGAATAQGDSTDAVLDDARECMRRRDWDAPPGHNFKELTDAALVRWPNHTRIMELRREAAEKIMSDALGRKYSGDMTEATRLVRLALELDPQLTTAQHLAAEIASAQALDVAPVVSVSAAPPDRGYKGPRRWKDPRAPATAPRSTASAELPPPPVPKRPDAGASMGPWL